MEFYDTVVLLCIEYKCPPKESIQLSSSTYTHIKLAIHSKTIIPNWPRMIKLDKPPQFYIFHIAEKKHFFIFSLLFSYSLIFASLLPYKLNIFKCIWNGRHSFPVFQWWYHFFTPFFLFVNLYAHRHNAIYYIFTLFLLCENKKKMREREILIFIYIYARMRFMCINCRGRKNKAINLFFEWKKRNSQ